MFHLEDLSIKKIQEGLLNKEFKAFDLVQAFLTRIEDRNKELNVYLSVDKDQALKSAEEADLKIAEGGEIGSLTGVPLAIKDVILVKDMPCTASSRILKDYVASYDATVISKIKKSGGIVLGKTNTDEFAMGSSTETSAYGPTKNPHDLERVPGGSSGGSAAAVASHFAIGSLGSDTGGSIRQPAGFCGVVGFKPTYGAVSRFGQIALSSSLDQIGPFANSVEDAEIIFDTIRGRDKYDATSFDLEEKEALSFEDLKDLTIGLPKEYFSGGVEKEVEEAVQSVINDFKSFGVTFKEISLPHTKYALPCYYIIQPAEASSNLARYDGIRYGRTAEAKNLLDIYEKTKGEGFGEEVKRRILLGTFVLSSGYYDAYYSKAQKVRRLIKEDFEKAYKEVDFILTPVSPTVPFKFGENTKNPMDMYLADIFTIPVNLAGIPGISIPVRSREGKLPIGFQLIAKWKDDKNLFALGKIYQEIK